MKLSGHRSEKLQTTLLFERFCMKRGDTFVVNSRGKDSLQEYLVV